MDRATESYAAGLVARERSGHTALLEGGFLYVWGGYLSIADDEVFLPNDEIWRYDIESGAWETHVMHGEVPPSMSGMCGSSLNGEMYIFGGCDDDGHTNQHYCVNLLDGKYNWSKVKNSRGAPPTPRDKLSCWVYKDRLIYFGGYGHKQLRELDNSRSFIVDEASWVQEVFWGWNNEVHVFDPSTNTWIEPHTQGLAPAPRAAHAGATLGSKGYVCGGRVMETRTNDIHCLDLESWTWTEIIPISPAPIGRSWHTLTAVSDNTLFLFGGLSMDCAPMSDGWIFDVQAKVWRQMEHPHKDKPRLWHTACLGKDSDVIVFGGSRDYILLVDTGHCNDALVFQTRPYSLLRLCEDCIGRNSKRMTPVKHNISAKNLHSKEALPSAAHAEAAAGCEENINEEEETDISHQSPNNVADENSLAASAVLTNLDCVVEPGTSFPGAKDNNPCSELGPVASSAPWSVSAMGEEVHRSLPTDYEMAADVGEEKPSEVIQGLARAEMVPNGADDLTTVAKDGEMEVTGKFSGAVGKAEQEKAELDEDDLPFDSKPLPAVLRNINGEDGTEQVICAHSDSLVLSFQNSLLYELD
ncbi:hypothetical protein AGOR_G00107640 [Albula goreensis]|uniref:Uncharacterized protein n=1 Tax=Albula goreensis TaxID=1534307 RepID=A0A8T3DIA0_9TELE|nr:hypothetical protein AGOR_G00107640 [Albula goreensis]